MVPSRRILLKIVMFQVHDCFEKREATKPPLGCLSTFVSRSKEYLKE